MSDFWIWLHRPTGLWQEKWKSDKPIGRASGQGLQDADPISAGYENECCIEERDINDACSQTTNFPLHLKKSSNKNNNNQSNKQSQQTNRNCFPYYAKLIFY